MKHRHGLVIGKFYPPHVGHHHLVARAASRAERVTVVVMAATVESLSLEARVRLMREVHANHANVTVVGIMDDHPVDYERESAWRVHVALMREATSRVTDEPIDAVFTSETYGVELARRLGATHESVDRERGQHPISGTAVRADPVRHWAELAPPVRGCLAWRVVLVGAESTGKTTLAAELAEHLRSRGGVFANATWVPEVGREVTAEKIAALGSDATMDSLTWESRDFLDIAREQARREQAAAREGAPVLICDTDAFTTGIWHERYRRIRSPEVEAEGAAPPFHLHLLTHPDDVPFEQDGLRDGEGVRAWMTDVFAERLSESNRRWQWLRGAREARREAAIQAIDALLSEGWRFADPLG